MMNKRKFPALSIVLFVFAGIILIYTVWAAVYSIDIISTLISQNQLVLSGNEFDLATFFMSSVGQYLIYAILLFSLGWIYQVNPSLLAQNAENIEQNNSLDELPENDDKDAFEDESFEDLDEMS